MKKSIFTVLMMAMSLSIVSNYQGNTLSARGWKRSARRKQKKALLLVQNDLDTQNTLLAVRKVKKSAPGIAPIDVTNEFDELRKYAEVLALCKKRSMRDFNVQKFIEESLKAAVPTCDAHSSFVGNLNTILEATSGKFSGIGVSIISKLPEDDGLVIVDVIESGPAQKGGMKAGDSIVEVNGEKLRGLSSDEVIHRLKGPSGTKVTLKALRDRKLQEFTLIRDTIKNEVSVSYHFKNQNIYYLSLRLFTDNAAKRISELLTIANEGKTRGIILDLRRNPGGILDTAIDMAGLFVDKGSRIVFTKDRSGKIVSEYKTTTDPILNSNTPVFILIDNFTASASEILAGSLRYYSEKMDEQTSKKRKKLMVFLVGTPTFGKGSVQEVIPISGGCALKLTTMLYYLPNEETIQATGIKPDFTIKLKLDPTPDAKLAKEFYGAETSIKHHITRNEVDKIDGKELAADKAAKSGPYTENKEVSYEEKFIKTLKGDDIVLASARMILMLDTAPKDKVNTRNKAITYLKQLYLTEESLDPVKVK